MKKIFWDPMYLGGMSPVDLPSLSMYKFCDLFKVEWLMQKTSFSVPKSFLYFEPSQAPKYTQDYVCLR